MLNSKPLMVYAKCFVHKIKTKWQVELILLHFSLTTNLLIPLKVYYSLMPLLFFKEYEEV